MNFINLIKNILESKLNSQFSLEEETIDVIDDQPLLSQVQNLIENGKGDPGRLQHIYDMLSNNKPLYHSDQLYLESKLEETEQTLPQTESEVELVISETKIESPDIRGSLPKGWTPSTHK